MWKFVTRRFRDTVERTYNVLDVRQTWTCGVDSKKDTKLSAFSSVTVNAETSAEKKKENVYIWRYEESKHNKRKSSQRKQYFHDDFSQCNGFISNAVVTTATLLSGFYLSQLLCLARRKHHLRHLDARFNLHLFEQSDIQQQARFNKNYCLLHWATSVYEKSFVPCDRRKKIFEPSDKRQNEFVYNDVNLESFYYPMPVSNDHIKHEKVHFFWQHFFFNDNLFCLQIFQERDTTLEFRNDDNVIEAIDNLMKTLGNIEFKLGLQNIQANEHKVAVSHFKLATTHRHPGATFNLGVCYEQGIGVDKNMKRAMKCYRAAAALGHKKAMYNLGVFYARGEGGLTKNREAAAACLLAADISGLKSGRAVFDTPVDMRKPDDEISFKANKLAIEDIHRVYQRAHLVG